MEVLAIVIFILILVLSPFLFVGWVVYSVVRAVAGGARAAVTHGTRAIGSGNSAGGISGHTVRCPVEGCLAVNPADAKFCRRCGHGLPAAQRVQVRRAAVW